MCNFRYLQRWSSAMTDQTRRRLRDTYCIHVSRSSDKEIYLGREGCGLSEGWENVDCKCTLLYEFQRRGGLVGYDAAFTRLRSGVQLPFPVYFYFLLTRLHRHKALLSLTLKYLVLMGALDANNFDFNMTGTIPSLDAALTQLRSWVQLPFLVNFISHTWSNFIRSDYFCIS